MGQGASIGGVEVEKPEGLSIEDVTNGNVALVFVKPHACNEAMVQFVKEELVKKKLVILGETPLGAEAIVEGDFVDRHYAGICGAAMKSGAAALSVADDKKAAFAEKFAAALEGKSYDDAVGAGLVLNCVEAMAKLGGDEPMSAKDLFAKWNLAEAQGAKVRDIHTLSRLATTTTTNPRFSPPPPNSSRPARTAASSRAARRTTTATSRRPSSSSTASTPRCARSTSRTRRRSTSSSSASSPTSSRGRSSAAT